MKTGSYNTQTGKSMKTCPYCAEEIQNAAVKSKHCGEKLFSQAVEVPAVIAVPTVKDPGKMPVKVLKAATVGFVATEFVKGIRWRSWGAQNPNAALLYV